MVLSDHNTMSPRQQMNASFLSMLMTDVGAKSASLFRFLYDEDNALKIVDDDDDDGKNSNNILFDNLWDMEDFSAPLVLADLPIVHVPFPLQNPRSRTKYPRMNQWESIWRTRFLVSAWTIELLLDWNGRLAKQFWKMFHTPYNVFLDLMKLEAERWWQEW